MLWNLDDSLPQLIPISYSQRQELLGPGGCLGLALAPFLNLEELSHIVRSHIVSHSQVPHCQARLAGVLTPHHQSVFLGPGEGFVDQKEEEGSWRVGVRRRGYLSEGEAGMLRPVRLATDTLKTSSQW